MQQPSQAPRALQVLHHGPPQLAILRESRRLGTEPRQLCEELQRVAAELGDSFGGGGIAWLLLRGERQSRDGLCAQQREQAAGRLEELDEGYEALDRSVSRRPLVAACRHQPSLAV